MVKAFQNWPPHYSFSTFHLGHPRANKLYGSLVSSTFPMFDYTFLEHVKLMIRLVHQLLHLALLAPVVKRLKCKSLMLLHRCSIFLYIPPCSPLLGGVKRSKTSHSGALACVLDLRGPLPGPGNSIFVLWFFLCLIHGGLVIFR